MKTTVYTNHTFAWRPGPFLNSAYKALSCFIFLFLLINTVYSQSFTATLVSNQQFIRPLPTNNVCGAASYGTFTYVTSGSSSFSYATQAFTPSVSGSGTITVTSATFSDPMLFVYDGSFSPGSPTSYFKVGDDDSYGSLLPTINCGSNYFYAGSTYIIVVTSYSPGATGTAYFTISGLSAAVLPTVTTTIAGSVTSSSAVLGGNITSDGGATVTSRGVAYGTSSNPTSGTSMGSGTGSYSQTVSVFSPGTTYYYRAYATNSVGTAYGTQYSFTTQSNPAPSDPTSISATANPICTGSSTQLTANGAVGTVYWYTGSCGGTYLTTGNPINVSPTSSTTYYARNYNNSQYSPGCASLTVAVEQNASAGTLTKSPNVATVCVLTNVSAALSGGSGGNGTNETQYRTFNGTSWTSWATYTPGNNISTNGITQVEVQTRRLASYCSSSGYNTVSWTVEKAPSAGSLAKTPNVDNVCEGTDVSAALTAGLGGNGNDETQFRTNNGSGWSSWATYSSGTNISTASITQVEIQTRRLATYCSNSGYTTVSWTVEKTPAAGSLTKSPDMATVCEGTSVSAVLIPGTGGNGYDETEYRTHDGTDWANWASYTSGTNISTTGKTGIEIRTRRLASYCSSSDYTTVSWSVEQTPVAGSLEKTPDVANVCEGTSVSAVLTPGTGGNGNDETEYRTHDGTDWANWASYTSGTDISTAGTTVVEIRTRKLASYCSSSDYTTASWTVEQTPVAGSLEKTPDAANVCEGTSVSAVLTPGTGGNQNDILEYRTLTGAVWSAWTVCSSGQAIPTDGLAGVEVQTYREADYCDDAAIVTVSWVVDPATAGGSVSGAATVCYGTNSTELTLSGYTGSILKWQKSTNDWVTPEDIDNTSSSFAAMNLTETTKYRAVVQSGVCSADYSSDATVTVLGDLTAPVIGSSQNIFYNTVPASLNMTTPATGGSETFAYQWQMNDGGGWNNVGTGGADYAPPALIASTDYRVIASDNGAYLCGSILSNTVSIVVDPGHTIAGTLKYYKNGAANLAMNNVELWLMDGAAKVAGYTTENVTGYYEFIHIDDGNYTIDVHANGKPVGGINATDAALLNWWSTHFTDIEPVKFCAGDVQNDYWMQASDAYYVQQYFIYSTPFIRTTATGTPWTYWPAAGNIIHSNSSPYNGPQEWPLDMTVTVPNDDVTFNIFAMSIGDYNGSFFPGGAKDASTTLHMISNSTVTAASGTELELPVTLINPAAIGAVSMILEFPADLVTITGVVMNGVSEQPEWSVKGNELRIGWNSRTPVNLAAGESVLNLRLTTTQSFGSGDVIRFSLAADPLNELADNFCKVIPDATVNIDAVASSTIGLQDLSYSNDLTLENHPNPFSDKTTISYNLPFEGKVTLVIRNMTGETIRTLADETQSQGIHQLILDGNSLAQGVYTASIVVGCKTGTATRTIKIVVTR